MSHHKRRKSVKKHKSKRMKRFSSNGPLTIIADPYENSYEQMKCALDLTSVSSTSSLYLKIDSPNQLSSSADNDSDTLLIDLTQLSSDSSTNSTPISLYG